MSAYRWSDNDRRFGSFIFARQDHYRPLAVVLGSGDDDDYPGCRMRLSGFGRTLIVALPPILKPWRRWVDTSQYEWSGTNGGYWDTHEREYGFSVSEGFLQVFFGPQTHDGSTTKSWSKFLPWTQWRHVRRSFYNLSGEHFWTEPRVNYRLGERSDWEALRAMQDACPSASFEFDDFDGERITANTRIEEREWRFGEGWFRWLSLFRGARIVRSLDIEFSKETGKRKGSWKGGTIGHSIDMLPGELHEQAFRRYCSQHDMTFVGAV